jgi:hypothetical protein
VQEHERNDGPELVPCKKLSEALHLSGHRFAKNLITEEYERTRVVDGQPGKI